MRQGVIALVTGAASGIGRAVVDELAVSGIKVYALDHDAVRLDESVSHWRSSGHAVEGRVLDCSDREALAALAAEIDRVDGRLDILMLNAGILVGGPIGEIAEADIERIVAVNQMAVVRGVRVFLPLLRRTGPGAAIVITSSAAGLCAFPFVAPYCMTKFAVAGFAESLAAELAPEGIAVLSVFPGMVRTAVFDNGRITLPGRGLEAVLSIFGRRALDPATMARRIVRAIRRRRRILTQLGAMWPLHLIKRLSPRGYQALWAFVTRRIVGRLEK
ncbi:MAG TPA: SDR family oxidoreductase [bacterium]|nr:SDR family oxidoreductase [bacterium]